ncbi:MAG: hypothetical protein EOM62_16155 [Bacteroidia bacterium]|nr:hypothetical protein [Bacteroidia bacterium]
MPLSAIRIFSPTEGLLSEKIEAINIKGREDARKLGPFCNSQKELMHWVRWYERSNGKKVKPHFKTYGDNKHSIRHLRTIIDREIQETEKEKKLDIHKKTQEILIKVIKKLISERKPINWAFNDIRLSDFPLTGNLLSEVVDAECEFKITPPFTSYYHLDIALIGNVIHSKPVLLGAIEIENTHEVDLLKTLLVKSLGFPLFTVDIKDVNYEEITEDWCLQRLIETTHVSQDHRRRNYVYLHNMLYPVYLSNFESWEVTSKHQYIVFADEKEFGSLCKNINLLKESLKLSNESVSLAPVNLNSKDKGSITMFENEGALAGPSWRKYNEKSFLRLVVERPVNKQGNIYLFHLVLTQLLTLYYNCLVGYKVNSGVTNWDHKDAIWKISRKYLNPKKNPKYIFENKRFCPKRVSEPINEILSAIPNAYRI